LAVVVVAGAGFGVAVTAGVVTEGLTALIGGITLGGVVDGLIADVSEGTTVKRPLSPNPVTAVLTKGCEELSARVFEYCDELRMDTQIPTPASMVPRVTIERETIFLNLFLTISLSCISFIWRLVLILNGNN
jgi:hypothetical protein